MTTPGADLKDSVLSLPSDMQVLSAAHQTWKVLSPLRQTWKVMSAAVIRRRVFFACEILPKQNPRGRPTPRVLCNSASSVGGAQLLRASGCDNAPAAAAFGGYRC
jgi:hypothetical protein